MNTKNSSRFMVLILSTADKKELNGWTFVKMLIKFSLSKSLKKILYAK